MSSCDVLLLACVVDTLKYVPQAWYSLCSVLVRTVRRPSKVPSQIGRGVPLKSAAGGGDGLLVVKALSVPSRWPTRAFPDMSTGPPR